jgi:SAM-dependent methyltransferase
MTARRHRDDWEELAALDPLWAILPADGTRMGRWDADRFFDTGRADVARLVRRMEELGRPLGRERALDIGCGVGRHARWLAAEFGDYLGVDVSAGMVERARRAHEGMHGIRFATADVTRLDGLESGGFDLVQCWLVLIHLPGRTAVLSALDSLVSVLTPGGLLAFQVVTRIAPRYRLQPRRRLYALLRRAGAAPRRLYRALGLNPVRMTAVGGDDVEDRLRASGARVLASEPASLGAGIEARLVFATKD